MQRHEAGAAGASTIKTTARRPRPARAIPAGDAVRSPWTRRYLSHYSRPGGLAPQLLETLAVLANHAAVVGRHPRAAIHPGNETLGQLRGLSARRVAQHMDALAAAGCVDLLKASRRKLGTRRSWTPHTWQLTTRGLALAQGRALPPDELAALAPAASRRPGRPAKPKPSAPVASSVYGRAVSVASQEIVSTSKVPKVLPPPSPPEQGGQRQDGRASPGPSLAPQAAPTAEPRPAGAAPRAGFGDDDRPRTAGGAFAPRPRPGETPADRERARHLRDRRSVGRRLPVVAADALAGLTLRPDPWTRHMQPVKAPEPAAPTPPPPAPDGPCTRAAGWCGCAACVHATAAARAQHLAALRAQWGRP